MTNKTLADDYMVRAQIRLLALHTLRDAGGYADVVRESQELVELILKAVLRRMGIEPPHWHEVSSLLMDHSGKLPAAIAGELPRVVSLSKALRKERELSYYGDEDYLPSEEYTREDADHYIAECTWLLGLVASK
jgi:HEPN domain-containing protein